MAMTAKDMQQMGPLTGFRIVELAGIGPAPMATMMLADMGAEVIRIERPGAQPLSQKTDVSLRGKKSVALDIKDTAHREALMRIVDEADALIDPYRPGVCEKLGIGPEACLARNPRLVFARMTGWGQEGPLAQSAGHDINYIALSGALRAFARKGERPLAPLNLVGDMGGGGMLAAMGILAAMLEAQRSGAGQVVDCAMVDGAAQQLWLMHSLRAGGAWIDEPESNLLDGGAYFYDSFTCADGKYVAIGAIEPQFHRQLIERLGLDPAQFDQSDRDGWPRQKELIAERIAMKSRDEWAAIMEGSDACLAPILDFEESFAHPANVARNVFVEVDGVMQAAPAPRFSRTPSHIAHGSRPIGADSVQVLRSIGYDDRAIAALGIDSLQD